RDQLRTLHQAVPGDRFVASQLAISLGFLGSALKNEQCRREAIACVKEARQVLEAIRQPSSTDLYNLACANSVLMTLVEPGSPAPTSAEQDALADQAVNSLRRSLAAGMKDFELIGRDRDLDPLRERPDFRALILEASGRI